MPELHTHLDHRRNVWVVRDDEGGKVAEGRTEDIAVSQWYALYNKGDDKHPRRKPSNLCTMCHGTGYQPHDGNAPCPHCGGYGHRQTIVGPDDVLRTKTGRVITETEIQALADEAEAGYDISKIKPRERPSP